MKNLIKLTVFVAVAALSVMPLLADTLVLKSGERVSGFFEGGSARVVKFRLSDGTVKDYDILSIQNIQFGDSTATTASPRPAPATDYSRAASPSGAPPTTASQPRLEPSSARPPSNPPSSNAANTAWTVPTGAKIVIRMIDTINSEQNQAGQTFVATLEEPISVGGVEVVPKYADVRGRIAKINEAGRVAGAAELGLELTQIVVNAIPYSITTSEYQEVGESRGGQTAKRAGGGAAVGAVIGAIAGGAKGAAIGAGVGAGGATAVQVLTKGEKLNIPAETKLEFTLRAPLVIAAK
jgi:hypothetical protein